VRHQKKRPYSAEGTVVAALGGGAIIDVWKSYMPEYAVFGY
jgi:hypothetical protein